MRRHDKELLREDQELVIFDGLNANPGPLPVRMRHCKVTVVVVETLQLVDTQPSVIER
ncbi:hypothetical protein F5B21DRAFT_470902 [Xylaria acuta]|nr:hypothetical protein F5B21DRAFT_470902 [Xylaria acuta]